MENNAVTEASVPDLLPARMLNEFAYCPRLFYLEWVQGEWEESLDTVEGRFQHRRVDRELGAAPTPPTGDGEAEEPESTIIHARSVLVSSPELRLIARIDLLEGDGTDVTPVDYKRGQVPETPEQSWEPDRVQLCAQGLILRENGFRCDRGVLYYAASRRRVEVPFTPELETRTRLLITEALEVARQGQIPPPLTDSPKCPRCSLVGICLPDEITALQEPEAGTRHGGDSDREVEAQSPVRRLFPARHDALPMYVQEQGAYVRRSGDRLVVTRENETKADVRVIDVSQLCLLGNVQISSQALRDLASRGVPICHFSYGGWFTAITTGHWHKNIELRLAQFRAASEPTCSLKLARSLVAAKVLNGRTLLRRNHPEKPGDALELLARMADQAKEADGLDILLGIEGVAARTYFAHFAGMLRPPRGPVTFDFEGRNRRPPRDPVNALLSYTYSLLVKDMTVTLLAVGFDPYLGFYHQPRYGRPALALDLMEEFRPIVADSVVITVINNGEIGPDDFWTRAGSSVLREPGRKRLIQAYERRMETLVRHPVFGYTISYRRVLEVQARLLARFILGEIPEYPPFMTR